jgi:hypothetical protein
VTVQEHLILLLDRLRDVRLEIHVVRDRSHPLIADKLIGAAVAVLQAEDVLQDCLQRGNLT